MYVSTLKLYISKNKSWTLPLAVNSSYFALFSLIICVLGVLLDANCPLDLFLHSDNMQQSWDGFLCCTVKELASFSAQWE